VICIDLGVLVISFLAGQQYAVTVLHRFRKASAVGVVERLEAVSR
jgi:hypothetical protein